ncbi:MAG: xanthine dehydrogenase small subunit [Xanthomonadales bacterium]|nr:xanthine dehydrogenase small subunit [Xanthomonadales bacterium]
MHNSIRFILAGEVTEINRCEPTRTVLEYLREDKDLKGTKEGCAEGDCGACTVVIGELHDGGIRYRAVNSCIQFLPTLDGKQLITVEDLATEDGKLHVVQQAMVDQHGSQCGFCTPGFVMSLFAMYHSATQQNVDRTDIDLGLAGNLCRCTGYAPIVRAAEQTLTAGRSDHFTADESRRIEQLQAIQASESLQLKSDSGQFFAPRSIAELCDLLQNHPQAVMVAGATDVGLWVTKHMRKLDTLISLGAVEELRQISITNDVLVIGAGVSYTDASQAIADRYPAFLPLIERLGATQVRNAGTVGGNIANGSPIGDMPPALIALGAKLVLRSTHGQRVIDLESYFISYGKQDLRGGEFVEQVILPTPAANQLFSTYKISKRFEQDISAVCAAFVVEINAGSISNARVCFGGMAEIPKRATCCEHALVGKSWDQETISNAMHAMLNDFTPLTDMRASDQYRMRVAQNLLQRFYLENSDNPSPVRLALRYSTAAGGKGEAGV